MRILAPFDVVDGARSRHRCAIGAQKDANGKRRLHQRIGMLAIGTFSDESECPPLRRCWRNTGRDTEIALGPLLTLSGLRSP
jgi:hypothetical protein